MMKISMMEEFIMIFEMEFIFKKIGFFSIGYIISKIILINKYDYSKVNIFFA
jgi:hypothetical protein